VSRSPSTGAERMREYRRRRRYGVLSVRVRVAARSSMPLLSGATSSQRIAMIVTKSRPRSVTSLPTPYRTVTALSSTWSDVVTAESDDVTHGSGHRVTS